MNVVRAGALTWEIPCARCDAVLSWKSASWDTALKLALQAADIVRLPRANMRNRGVLICRRCASAPPEKP